MSQTITKYYNSTGANNVIFPIDVSSAQIEGIGGGGAGAYRNATGNGGGGSGGGYARLNAFSPGTGTIYTINVGVGGNTANNANGTNTTFNSTSLIAKGGVTAGRNNATGQAAATSQTGDVTHDAGAGANNGTSLGGGGSSSGGNAANGRAGQVQVGGGNGSDSGNLPAGAGAGGNGAATGNANGSNGVFPGGAGGGATRTAGNHLGGNGAGGQAILTYTTAQIDVLTWLESESLAVTPSPFQYNFTFPAGYSNTGLFIFIQSDAVIGLSGVTYGGQTMSEIASFNDEPNTGNLLSCWFLAAPPTGSNQVSISYASSLSEIVTYCVAMVNVAQSNQPDGQNGVDNGISTSVAASIVTGVANALPISLCNVSSNLPTPAAGQLDFGAGGGNSEDASFSGAIASAGGTATHTYTMASDRAQILLVTVAPFVASGTQYYSFLPTLGAM